MMKVIWCAVLVLLASCVTYAKEDPKIALVMSGSFDDFGYNYMLNFGRILMEQALNISTTTLIQNVETKDQAIAMFEMLAQDGYDLIISGSFEHGDAIASIAGKYPDTYFIDKGKKKPPHPNINRVFFNGVDTKFIMGLYSGLMTKTGKVGIVVPGPPDYYSTNTFYIGAKNGNPDCTVYSIATGTYLDPDLASGATKKLLDLGVDVIGQIQDDSTVTETTMAAGLLGIGNTGFPLSNIYGEKLGLGFVQDWSPFFIPIVTSILNDSWVPFRLMEGGLFNDQQGLDKLSYRVPEGVRLNINTSINRTKDEPFYYLCGPLVAEMRTNLSANCITQNDMLFAAFTLAGVADLGNYTIPLTEFTVSDSVKLGFTSVASIVLILTGLAMILLAVIRNAEIVRSSSVLFTEIMCTGAVLIFVAVLLWIQVPTDAICSARVWLISLGYDLFIGSLLIKNIRIWRIFDNPDYKPRKYPDFKLLIWLAITLVIDVILLAIWNSVADPKAFDAINLDGIGKYNYMTICTTHHNADGALYTILVVHLLWLLFGCYLSYKLKSKVSMEQFNEGEQVAMILYSIAICISIVIPFLVASQKTESEIVIICTAMVFTATGGLIILFGPKIIYVSKNGMRFSKRSSSNSARTTSKSGHTDAETAVSSTDVKQSHTDIETAIEMKESQS